VAVVTGVCVGDGSSLVDVASVGVTAVDVAGTGVGVMIGSSVAIASVDVGGGVEVEIDTSPVGVMVVAGVCVTLGGSALIWFDTVTATVRII
jgi:hypothetical protein